MVYGMNPGKDTKFSEPAEEHISHKQKIISLFLSFFKWMLAFCPHSFRHNGEQ